MKKSQIKILNERLLEADIRKYANVYCQAAAEEAMYKIWSFAHQQMKEYYGEYSGRYYTTEDRTNQELNQSYHIFKEFAHGTYRGGIIFDNDLVSHALNRGTVDEDYIENMVWTLGYHGYELEGYKGKYGDKRTWEAIAGTPDRLGLVKEYRDSEELKTIALQAGNRKARSQKYNILQFS